MVRGAALVFAGALLVSACGGGSSAAPGEDNSAGMGVPQQFASESFPGERREVRTRVYVADNGCFLSSRRRGADRPLLVWPVGTEQGSSGDELELPDGTVLGGGDVLVGQGALVPVRRLEGFGSDGYWDMAVGFCAPDASRVLVLDSVTVQD